MVICNSYSENVDDPGYYFIQYYRSYITGDFIGDDILFPKINDNFAFAAYFEDDVDSAPVSCTN